MGGLSSFAAMPLPGDYPPGGWFHVGWRCTSPGHECLRTFADVVSDGGIVRDGGRVLLRLDDSDHLAGWTPVFAKLPEE